MAFSNAHYLVDVAHISQHLADENLRIIDCAWDGAAYGRAHIPGAVLRPGHSYIKALDDVDTRSYSVPDVDAVRKLCRNMGIGPESDVVIYDDLGSLFATRLWWVLRYYGFEHVRILDGGWQAWASAGHPVSYQVPVVPVTASLELKADPRRIIGMEELIRRHADSDLQLLDVRTDDEYFGVVFKGNKRKGRIPGATHLAWNRLLENSADAKAVRMLRPEAEVEGLIAAAGLDSSKEVVTHCQAAIRATHTAFVLEMMGFPPVRVYDGSMEEWANTPDAPLES